MSLGKNLITVIVCLNILVSSSFARKSVFIISSHAQSHAQAYSIEGTQVDYQAQVDIDTYNAGMGLGRRLLWPASKISSFLAIFYRFKGNYGNT